MPPARLRTRALWRRLARLRRRPPAGLARRRCDRGRSSLASPGVRPPPGARARARHGGAAESPVGHFFRTRERSPGGIRPLGVPAAAALRAALRPADPARLAARARLQRHPLRARLSGEAAARQRGVAARRPGRGSEARPIGCRGSDPGRSASRTTRRQRQPPAPLTSEERVAIEQQIQDSFARIVMVAVVVVFAMPLFMFSQDYLVAWVLGQHHDRHEARRVLEAARAAAALPPGPPPRRRARAHHAGRRRRARRARAGLRGADPAGR